MPAVATRPAESTPAGILVSSASFISLQEIFS
jgi:hypothetical protein